MAFSGLFRIDTKMQLLFFAFQSKSLKPLLVQYIHSCTLNENNVCKEVRDFLDQYKKTESLEKFKLDDPACIEAITASAIDTIRKKDGFFYLLAHSVPLVNRIRSLQKKITKGNIERYIENIQCVENEIDLASTYSAITTGLKLSSSEKVLLMLTFDSNLTGVSELIGPEMTFAEIFLIAVICGSLSVLDILWKHEENSDVTKLGLTTSKKELTALHFAILTGNARVVEWLLRKDFAMEAVNENGDTGLHLAVSAGHREIVEMLISFGSSVNSCNTNKQTPLHKAAAGGHREIVDILIKNNADVEAQNASGNTALIAATENGHLIVVDQLLNYGASIYAMNFKDNSSLHRAAFQGHSEIAKLILSRGNDIIDARNDNGKTALHIAAERGHLNVVRLLLERKANIHSQNNFGQTPLHEASRHGHEQVAEFLLKNGASGKITDLKNRTALHEAAWNGHVAVVDLLVHHSDINAVDYKDDSALRLAERFGKTTIVEILKNADGN